MTEQIQQQGSELPGAPAHGVTLKAFLVDEFGREHITTSHTTIPEQVFMAQGTKIRAALEQMYALMNIQLLSLQRVVEAEPIVLVEAPAERPRHLRLVASGGKRVFSQEVKVLMESAGLDEGSVRRDVYGEEP